LRDGPASVFYHTFLNVVVDIILEKFTNSAPMDKAHVLEIQKIYRKLIMNVLIDNIFDNCKGKRSKQSLCPMSNEIIIPVGYVAFEVSLIEVYPSETLRA
jgi:hypothetical protein